MAQAINAPQKALLVRPSIRRSSYTGTHSCPIGLNHSLTSPIVSGRHWMIVMCGSPSLVLKSRIDALQRTFPTMGRNPIERGGLNSCARLAGRARHAESGLARRRLLGRCFSTRCIGILGSPRKRDFAKDGIPVPGHKPIQQIAEGLDQWKAQED